MYFDNFFDKPHFVPFPVFYTKYLVVLGDKKIQIQKWCTAEKFWLQKLGVYLYSKWCQIFILTISWKFGCSATWLQYYQGKNFLWADSVIIHRLWNMFKVPGGILWQFFLVQTRSDGGENYTGINFETISSSNHCSWKMIILETFTLFAEKKLKVHKYEPTPGTLKLILIMSFS